jgi:hypothetical protein
LLLSGCASVTVLQGAEVRRLWMPPGLNIVQVDVSGAGPVVVETRGLGVTVARSGAYVGAMQERLSLLPADGRCRVITMRRASREQVASLTRYCSSQGGSE